MSLLSAGYTLARPALFSLDAETAHRLALGALPLLAPLAGRHPPDPILARRVGPLTWPGPVGLAAGLDKAGEAIPTWAALGFGAVEVGTVTAQAQPGNPRPRLFRLPEERALLNRMGFNNDGAPALAARLRALRERSAWPLAPVGVNLGKSKVVPNEAALADHLATLEALRGLADYLVVNVSSPNTPGLRALQEAEPLRALLSGVVPAAAGVPVFLKLAPDLEVEALEEAVDVALACGITGLIATNTTLTRPGDTGRTGEAGGLSGAPLAALAREKLGVVLKRVAGRAPVIGVGGIATAEDVLERLRMGCAAVQIYTAFVYEGPGLPARLHAEIAERARVAGSLDALVEGSTARG
jgi:dihydroorotate dehydrogenase